MSGPDARTPDRTEDPDPWTVPNVICGLRIAGLGPLLWTAHEGYRQAFVVILVVLLLSDWLDGKLAVLLEQRTTFGARLDSLADALMYGALAPALWWLERGLILEQGPWMLAAVATWGMSVAVALVRWGRMPSYHTWGAKISWLLVGTATVTAVLSDAGWPVAWALSLVVLTNLEAAAIGCALPEWRADVPTLVHALRIRGADAGRRGED